MSLTSIIYDKNPIEAAHLSLMLKRKGQEVITAKDEGHFFALLKRKKVNCILIDENATDIHKVLKKIPEERHHQTKIIMMTSYSLNQIRNAYEEKGVNCCIQKPIYQSNLTDVFDKIG
ncbi:response regulator [Sediminitomix flava]|uniref:CheY-like chemotaxis protein n=1 Tax=Sediminitomix flava TaxID=379075 RepID=A0A315ZHE6_SEDFL|nr:response regulator [Sediminitomix flava]PWJ44619.1 CheY-like chemotaxis protein [Sediminitomix flava]